MKMKTNLQPQIKNEMLGKILSEKSFNDKSELYHHAIITFRRFDVADDKIAVLLQNVIGNICKTTFNTVLTKIDNGTNDALKAVTGINLNCFRFIREKVTEDDLSFMQGKEKRNITLDELQYYLFRITKKAFIGGGYTSDVRNYYTQKGFKKEYKARTKRAIGKEKIAEMNKILTKYDWIRVYQKKKTPNLFVMGEQNPFYYMEGIMEPKTVAEIGQMIKGNERFPVKGTQKDKEVEVLKKQLTEAKSTIDELKKQIEKIENQTPDSEALQEEVEFLTKRNQELLDENMKYQQQEDENQWDIHSKTVRKPNTFESDLPGFVSDEKEETVPEMEVMSGMEYFDDAVESLLEITTNQ